MIVAQSGIDFFTESALIDMRLDRSEIGPVAPESRSFLTERVPVRPRNLREIPFTLSSAIAGAHPGKEGPRRSGAGTRHIRLAPSTFGFAPSIFGFTVGRHRGF